MTADTSSKKNRLEAFFPLLMAVLMTMACMGVVGISIAAESNCGQLLSGTAYKTFSRAKIRQIQDSLVVTGYDPREIDGIIGPNSQAALKQFCSEFSNEFRKDSIDDLVATLFLYAAIAKISPA